MEEDEVEDGIPVYDQLLLHLREDETGSMGKSSHANVESALRDLQAVTADEEYGKPQEEEVDSDIEDSGNETEDEDEDEVMEDVGDDGNEEEASAEEDDDDDDDDNEDGEEDADGLGAGRDWFSRRFEAEMDKEEAKRIELLCEAAAVWAKEEGLVDSTLLPNRPTSVRSAVTVSVQEMRDGESAVVLEQWKACVAAVAMSVKNEKLSGNKKDYTRLFEPHGKGEQFLVDARVKRKLLERFLALSGSQLRKARRLQVQINDAEDEDEVAELQGKKSQVLKLKGKRQLMLFAESLSLLSTYTDVLLSDTSFLSSPQLPQALLGAVLHSVNHVVRSRDLVVKHTQKLRQLRVKGQEIIARRKLLLKPLEDVKGKSFDEKKKKRNLRKQIMTSDEMRELDAQEAELRQQEMQVESTTRDQGFTPAKVLILVPMQEMGGQVVSHMLSLLHRPQVHRLKKFQEDFLPEDRDLRSDPAKPADWNATFHGNTNDSFCIGVQVTKQSIKLYSDFFTSDIIVASPLGLRLKIEHESMAEGEHDFLSSIEVLVMHMADVYHMQNWEHIEYILDRVNRVPAKPRRTDFARVRPYFLEGWGKHYRQTIVTCSRITPEINSVFVRRCTNWQGKIRIAERATGVVQKVVGQVQQRFERVVCNNMTELAEARFQHFKHEVLPKLRSSAQGHTLIFIPSYFDYVRVRNLFKAENISCVTVADYTPRDEVSRARSWFYHGEVPFMLFTERYHFFHRYKIRGIRNIVFYALPMYEEFYFEMVNMADNAEGSAVSFFVSPYDRLVMERVVGPARCRRMLRSAKRSHLLVTS